MIKVKLLNQLTITFTDDGKIITQNEVEISPCILKSKLTKFDWCILLSRKEHIVKNAIKKMK